MQDFRKLDVWKKAHELTLKVYDLTATLPKDEQFGLTSQIRRSCSSIPANIAEGCGRNGNAELLRFVSIASGSASELEYHLLLAHDLGHIALHEYQSVAEEVTEIKRMLAGFQRRLRPQPTKLRTINPTTEN